MALYSEQISDIHDLKEVKDTLSSISDRLRYYFRALSIEDNFSPEEFLKYQETGEKLAILEKSSDGLISTYGDLEEDTSSQIQAMYGSISLAVTKGDVTNQLNLEPGALSISGNRLEIYGDNINLDAAGNLIISGEIEALAGSIAGWDITSGKLTGSSTSKITCDELNTSNYIWLDLIEVNGDSDFSGCTAEFGGTNLETDMSTIFMNGFDAEDISCYGEVIAGPMRIYESVDVMGQITCRTCHTTADGSTWSDRRLKEDIRDISDQDASDMLMQLKPYRYRFRRNNRVSCGFMAQDIENIQQDMGHDYGIISKGKTMSLSYISLIPFLIKAIQRQAGEIDELPG